ncbi:MAG: glycoside hydrolase family 127 protein, partial [Planctomycetaceae bacterium]|nr:glycoside hydrolase family 127 protein [Planctomycetaceae bacterium]
MLTRIFITLFLCCFVIGETGADWLDGRMKHVVPTAPQKRSPFPLEEVRLLSGPFYEAQQRELTYLLTVQPDRLL